MTEHKVKLDNRREYENGLVKYNVKVLYDKDEDGDYEVIFDGDYGLNLKQEEMDRFESMMENFGKKKIEEYEKNKGKNHEGKTLTI